MSKCISIIAHDMRSTHNVGALLRTAEGMGVAHVYLTGYTPHPEFVGDSRLPHIAHRQTLQIKKTALGAEKSQVWSYHADLHEIINKLRSTGTQIVALEQDSSAIDLPKFSSQQDVAIILGREVEGMDQTILELCDVIVQIPMFGSKESFNVVQAAAMALYHLRFVSL